MSRIKVQEGIVEGYRLFSIVKGRKGDFLLGSLDGKVESNVYPRRARKAIHLDRKTHNLGLQPQLSFDSIVYPYKCPCTVKDFPISGDFKRLHISYFRCGFNFFRYAEHLNHSLWEANAYIGYLICSVYGWGKTVPGEKGFRTEYMYPKSILGVLGRTNAIPVTDCTLRLSRDDDSHTLINSRVLYLGNQQEYSYKRQVNINIEPIKLLWKIARLYRIGLELEMPDWLTRREDDGHR